MKKSMTYYLVRLNRISGWCLVAIVPILFISGYGTSGRYEWVSTIASADLHSRIHRMFTPFMLYLCILHAGINILFACKKRLKK